jgi:excisionase family DNA binding protein
LNSRANTELPFRLLNKRDVAAIFGCTVRTIDRMMAARLIPFLRIPTGAGGRTRTRFHSRDVDQWLEQHRRDSIDDQSVVFPVGYQPFSSSNNFIRR